MEKTTERQHHDTTPHSGTSREEDEPLSRRRLLRPYTNNTRRRRIRDYSQRFVHDGEEKLKSTSLFVENKLWSTTNKNVLPPPATRPSSPPPIIFTPPPSVQVPDLSAPSSHYKSNRQLNSRRFLPIRAVAITPIIADGNCFFRAISMYFYGSECRHLEIRFQIADWLESDAGRAWFSQGEHLDLDTFLHGYQVTGTDPPLPAELSSQDYTPTHKDFLEYTRRPGTWANRAHRDIVAHLYPQVRFNFWETHSTPFSQREALGLLDLLPNYSSPPPMMARSTIARVSYLNEKGRSSCNLLYRNHHFELLEYPLDSELSVLDIVRLQNNHNNTMVLNRRQEEEVEHDDDDEDDDCTTSREEETTGGGGGGGTQRLLQTGGGAAGLLSERQGRLQRRAASILGQQAYHSRKSFLGTRPVRGYPSFNSVNNAANYGGTAMSAGGGIPVSSSETSGVGPPNCRRRSSVLDCGAPCRPPPPPIVSRRRTTGGVLVRRADTTAAIIPSSTTINKLMRSRRSTHHFSGKKNGVIFMRKNGCGDGDNDEEEEETDEEEEEGGGLSNVKWTHEEVEQLLSGTTLFGHQWTKILSNFRFSPTRTAAALKMKWRDLNRRRPRRTSSTTIPIQSSSPRSRRAITTAGEEKKGVRRRRSKKGGGGGGEEEEEGGEKEIELRVFGRNLPTSLSHHRAQRGNRNYPYVWSASSSRKKRVWMGMGESRTSLVWVCDIVPQRRLDLLVTSMMLYVFLD